MNKSCFLLLFIFVLQIYSCKKSTTGNSSQPSGPNVYVAGAEAGNPAYWKNDSDWFLTGAFSVSGIYVSGNDVYVAGEVTDGNGAETYYGITNKAAYWKNDSLVTVSDGSTHVQVNS